jgi:enoyl-CoA hydratase/carnithine racemase
MPDPILIRQDHGAIAVLTLNAPDRLNALSAAMLAGLAQVLDALAQDGAIRVVVLRGAGKAFCAGHDLREMQAARSAPDAGRAELGALFADCAAVMLRLRRLPQPVIAQVHGTAAAAGCQLVASCDMALAAEGARFGVNGVNIGLFCSTPMVALTRAVPAKAAFEMLTTGAFIDAARARDLGLINRVVPPEILSSETMALAGILAAKLGDALRIGKRAFYEQLERPEADAYAHTGAVMLENMLWRDTAEGMAAFLEKRAPHWQNSP